MTADDTAEVGHWLHQPARDVERDWGRPTASQRLQRSRIAYAPDTTQATSSGACLLKLHGGMRQDAKKEFWVVVALWAASWGAVALICV